MTKVVIARGRETIVTAREQIAELAQRMGRSIVGQEHIIERLLLGLLANGNLLVEGLPGLAKTRAVKALASNLEVRGNDSSDGGTIGGLWRATR